MAQAKAGIIIDKTQLHLIGLVSVFISSKYEDAGHKKFEQRDIL